MKKGNYIKIFMMLLTSILLISSLNAIGFLDEIEYNNHITNKNTNRPYDGTLRVYVVEPESRWDDYDGNPYHFAVLDIALEETLSIEFMDTYNTQLNWKGSDYGYDNIQEDNIMVIAAVFNPESNKRYANPPTKNPFNAFYVDATAGARPGNQGENIVTSNFTHTVFAEEATATWCPYCPYAANGLYNIYSSEDYPFYFVAMVADKNEETYNRLEEDYNLYGYPSSFFDGGYKVVVGGFDTIEKTFRRRIESCGSLDVHELDLKLNVEWMDNGELDITIAITSNEITANIAPYVPNISGPSQLKPNREYEFIFTTTDLDGDDVYYYIDWGDGNKEEWIGPYTSESEVKIKHKWTEKAIFTIKAKAKDINDLESSWTEFKVSTPKNILTITLLQNIINKLRDLS
jgi:hypothetical protein